MPAAPVPVAVVGVGNMGRHHARNYDRLARAELRAVVDSDRQRAEQLAAAYGASAYTTVEQLLERSPEVEAVSLATPTRDHAVTGALLLEGAKHLLVEKPIAATAGEADALIALAARKGVVLAVGHVERFNPAVRALRRHVDDGRMGELLSLVARRVGVMPPQVRDANVLVDLAVHDIDIFRYLLDAGAPDELHCNAGKAIAQDRFDFADLFLRFGSVACFLQVNWLTPVKIRSLAVTGTAGYAELEYVTQRLAYYDARPVREVASFDELEAVSEREPELVPVDRREPLAAELDEFLKAVRGEPAEIVPGEEAKISTEIAIAATALAGRS